jgi:hypothetical protein
LDYKKPVFIGLDQAEVMESRQKQAYPRLRRADHLGQFFMSILSSMRMLRGSFLPVVRTNCNNVWPNRCPLSTVTRLAITCC